MAKESTALQERPTRGPAKSLLIVARDRRDLWQVLTQEFATHKDIVVLLDRRQGERRQSFQPYAPDRRRAPDRRSWPKLEEDVHLRQYMLIRPKRKRFED